MRARLRLVESDHDGAFETNNGYTIASNPPPAARGVRRSWWREALKGARCCPGEWRQLSRTFAKSTAVQVASDLHNAHRRDLRKSRITGLLAGDRWEARYGVDDSDCIDWVDWDSEVFDDVPPTERNLVWIRFVADK
jgi:hypothetical protein